MEALKILLLQSRAVLELWVFILLCTLRETTGVFLWHTKERISRSSNFSREDEVPCIIAILWRSSYLPLSMDRPPIQSWIQFVSTIQDSEITFRRYTYGVSSVWRYNWLWGHSNLFLSSLSQLNYDLNDYCFCSTQIEVYSNAVNQLFGIRMPTSRNLEGDS